jgi:ribosomal protein S18 acetylase RimI-like enzyme
MTSASDLPARLLRIERYLDAVPRTSARAEDIGPLTLFVASQGWPMYARPRLDAAERVRADDVAAVAARQRELDVPVSFEWVDDIAPSMTAAVREAGLVLTPLPVLALDGQLTTAQLAPGWRVRRLDADDSAVTVSSVVASLGFGTPGTQVGPVGTLERQAGLAERPSDADAALRQRIADGRTVTYVVDSSDDGIVATGAHQPVNDVSEIVGVATLPSFRRRGIAAALVAALAKDALGRGVDLLFLSAGDDAVARVYESLGMRRVATGYSAAPSPTV